MIIRLTPKSRQKLLRVFDESERDPIVYKKPDGLWTQKSRSLHMNYVVDATLPHLSRLEAFSDVVFLSGFIYFDTTQSKVLHCEYANFLQLFIYYMLRTIPEDQDVYMLLTTTEEDDMNINLISKDMARSLDYGINIL